MYNYIVILLCVFVTSEAQVTMPKCPAVANLTGEMTMVKHDITLTVYWNVTSSACSNFMVHSTMHTRYNTLEIRFIRNRTQVKFLGFRPDVDYYIAVSPMSPLAVFYSDKSGSTFVIESDATWKRIYFHTRGEVPEKTTPAATTVGRRKREPSQENLPQDNLKAPMSSLSSGSKPADLAKLTHVETTTISSDVIKTNVSSTTTASTSRGPQPYHPFQCTLEDKERDVSFASASSTSSTSIVAVWQTQPCVLTYFVMLSREVGSDVVELRVINYNIHTYFHFLQECSLYYLSVTPITRDTVFVIREDIVQFRSRYVPPQARVYTPVSTEDMHQYLHYVGGPVGALALTAAAAGSAYYLVSRPVSEKPLVPPHYSI